MRLTRSSFATLILSTLALTLSACGGQPLVFNGNPAPEVASSSDSSEQTSSEEVSSEQSSSQASSTNNSSTNSLAGSSTSSVVSSSKSSSVVSSSKSSSVSSSASGPTGAQLYTSPSLLCSTCHGANGQGNGSLGGELLNCVRCSNLSQLTQYISDNMPSHAPGTCTGTCAQTLGLYIYNNLSATSAAEPLKLLKQAEPTNSEFSLLTTADTSCSVTYSENDLRPLTKQEYANTVLRLTGIDLISNSDQSIYDALPPDNLVSTFYNNEAIVIDSDTRRAYQNVANKIVAQLYSQNFNGIVDCNNINSEECYNKLIDDFACKIFRRPLTAEERTTYQPLFTGDKKDGIKNIINVLLSSPAFIYRSNIGLTFINSEDGSVLANGAPLINSTKTIRIYEKETLNASFIGNDVLEIAVKATQSPTGLWPVMRIQVGLATFVDLSVKHADTQIYRLNVTGLTGSNSVTIINQQTGAALEYQTGHNLVVSSVKLLSSD